MRLCDTCIYHNNVEQLKPCIIYRDDCEYYESEEDMNEVGVEIVKTEEAKENGIKYLNINVSNSEVERNPDRVRLCADAGIVEYVKPSGDLISRQAVIDTLDRMDKVLDEDRTVEMYRDLLKECYTVLPSVNPQEPKTEQFAKWVATEIFDDMWEYNKDAFAEIACRKLAKLGIVRAKGDEWELVEPQESEGEE